MHLANLFMRTVFMGILLVSFGAARESQRNATLPEPQVMGANPVQIITVDATPGHATNKYSP
jgi:hypothetical protein